jgi:ankyrin repeat protein
MNRNGDTPLLLACRNGQSDVAKLLLDYCDSDFVHFRAEIDGFDALFASVESDRPDCVRLIHEYGVSLEERTSEDNAILRSATPLHLAAYYGRHSSAQLLLQLGADPNSRDANGMTPLHIAVLRKHHPIIELLINKKADPFIVDKSGNPPASFARDPKVLALLVNPLTAPLHELCAIRPRSSSGFTIDEVQDLLTTKAAVPGLTNPATVIADARDHRGMSPLATAVVHGNFEVVEILLSLGLDSTIPDSRGMSAQMWAQWTKNPRIQRLLNVPTQDFPQTERIRTAAKASPEAMALLFLGDPQPPALIASSLSLRMSLLSTLSPVVDSVLSMRRQIVYDCSSTDLMTIYASQNGRTSADASFIQQQLKKVSALSFWQAKIEAVSAIGAACTESLLPAQLVALFLYSCDPVICELVSYYLTGRCASDDAELQSTIFPLIKSLLTAVNSLPPFAAEVYAASLNIDRSVFPIGAVVSSPLLLSATSLWPIAVESLNFEKEGTVFIIKSSNAGRMIATHSRFPFESEVLFPAETKFVVTQWYKGDVIALGQPNIREHTFGLNEEQRVTYAGTRKPLIIELKEV